jgi:hypothetical protein
MSGGPINGVPWSATAASAFQIVGGVGYPATVSAARRGSIDTNDPANYTGIIVPTVLQIAADVLSYWTSITCLYDRYWESEQGRVTLPICLFHVTKITEIWANEVSKKRVILYAQGGEDVSDTMRPGVMQTITDNIVKQPKTYQLEIIIPFQPIGRYISEVVKTVSDMITAFSDLLGGTGFTDVWEGIFSSVFAMLKTASTAAEFAGKLPGMDGVSYINKNSLEAMAESGRSLCMKMWTGFDYKYVVITNMSIEKRPLEDDVFRGTLQLQEMPVLAVTPPKQMLPVTINRNWAVTAISAVQGALVTPLIAMTGVKKAAGGGDSGIGMIKKSLEG